MARSFQLLFSLWAFFSVAAILAAAAANAASNVGTTKTFPIKTLLGIQPKRDNLQAFAFDPETLVSIEDAVVNRAALRSQLHAHGAVAHAHSGPISHRHVLKRDQTSSSIPSVVNSSETGISYYVELQIGTQEADNQTFNLIIDTGSYYSWVYSADCQTSACAAHAQFNPETSNTSVFTNTSFAITYTTGTVNGTFIEDRVRLAGFDFAQQRIGLASNIHASFANFSIDGILGLPATDVDPDATPGIMNTLYNQSLISKRIFAVNLGGDEGSNDEGSFTIGGVDESKFTGDIEYTSINPDSLFWEAPIAQTTINDQVISFADTENGDDGQRVAIVDTGTTLLLMPPEDAIIVHSYIENAITDGSNFVIPCNASIELSLYFGNSTEGRRGWPITPQDYIGSVYGDNGLCISNIQGMQFEDNRWVLGGAFLKSVYSVYDMDNNTVGFATKRASKTVVTPESSFISNVTVTASTTTTSASSTSSAAGSSSTVAPSSTTSSSSSTTTTTASSSSAATLTAQLWVNLTIFAFLLTVNFLL